MLTQQQSELLTEILNAGVGRAGSVLSELVGCRVRMQIPVVGVSESEDLSAQLGLDDSAFMTSVCQQFRGSMDGFALLLLSRENGNALAQRLIGEAIGPATLDAERGETLVEVGNILTNSVLGTIANVVGHHFEYQVPVYREGSLREIIESSSKEIGCRACEAQTLFAQAHFKFDSDSITGSVLILLPTRSFDHLVSLINGLSVGAS